MKVTKNKIRKCVDVGDVVFVLANGKYTPTKVKRIDDDCLDTDEDLLFYDEIGEFWCLCESTAKKITQKSQ